MSKHEKFILTPITIVIEEMIAATSCIGDGIETYPLWDYIIQSTFTKMTGFQEQKVKCIDWELATNGFDYRRIYIEEVKNRGTYSTYDAKKQVYNALVSEIVRYSGVSRKDLITELKKRRIEPDKIIEQIFRDTNVVRSKQREYSEFLTKCKTEINNQYYIVPDEKSKSVKLFESSLQSHYENELYRQRNRIAHNTLSYQQNLPDLETLREDELSRNYFFWFSILVLIDEIFMDLYRYYAQCVKDNSYFD